MLNNYEIKRKQNTIFEVMKLVLLSVCIYCVCVVMPVAFDQLEQTRPQYEQESSIRVVAQNNSKSAILLKEHVASEVLQVINDDEVKLLTPYEVVNLVKKRLSKLEELKNNAYRIHYGSQRIPPKLVGGKFYPQDMHNVLQVTIGEGKGDNFFCALFPNVCQPEAKKKKEKFKFKWFEKIFKKTSKLLTFD